MTTTIGKNQLIETPEQVRAVVQAIAFAIDTREVQEALEDLGLKVEVNEVDASQGLVLGRFTIEGGENETGFIATLEVTHIEYGFNSLTLSRSDKTDG